MALRFGLVGTGHWAQITHAPALATTPGIDFAAVWGRNPEATAALAASHQAVPHHDLDAFLAAVDGVAFSVPPDVQAPIAVRAARAGKHLLLEKPVATSTELADEVVQAVRDTGVASVVFFTARFRPDVRAWLAEVGGLDGLDGQSGQSGRSGRSGRSGQGGWAGGSAIWLGSAWHESSPFNTPWRRDKGGLWDLGPHAVSLLWAGLGPVVSVSADAGQADVTHLVLHHASGVTSTVTVTLSAPPAAAGFELRLWGERGWSAAPTQDSDPVDALRTALTELAAAAASGQPHPCDAAFGRDVVAILAAAQHHLPQP